MNWKTWLTSLATFESPISPFLDNFLLADKLGLVFDGSNRVANHRFCG
jgi:hypothetical protein